MGNIYEEEELTREATCSKKEQVQIEGGREVKRNLDFYNLDAIIAVGYRVNSKKATKFRQWATKTLKEYITNGFVLDDDIVNYSAIELPEHLICSLTAVDSGWVHATFTATLRLHSYFYYLRI